MANEELIYEIVINLTNLTTHDGVIWQKEVFNCFSCEIKNWKIYFEFIQDGGGQISIYDNDKLKYSSDNLNYTYVIPLNNAIWNQYERLGGK